VAQLDSALASEANDENTQPTQNKEFTNPTETDTPDYSLSRFELPAELQFVIEQWNVLPSHVKETIKMLVETVKKNSGVS